MEPSTTAAEKGHVLVNISFLWGKLNFLKFQPRSWMTASSLVESYWFRD